MGTYEVLLSYCTVLYCTVLYDITVRLYGLLMGCCHYTSSLLQQYNPPTEVPVPLDKCLSVALKLNSGQPGPWNRPSDTCCSAVPNSSFLPPARQLVFYQGRNNRLTTRRRYLLILIARTLYQNTELDLRALVWFSCLSICHRPASSGQRPAASIRSKLFSSTTTEKLSVSHTPSSSAPQIISGMDLFTDSTLLVFSSRNLPMALS